MPNPHIRDLYTTRLFLSSDLPEVCRFIAALNSQPEHHIAYYGTTLDEIEYYLLNEQTIPPEESYLLARSEDSLAGVIGLEYDLDLGRAWIEGPLISIPDWEGLAELLYERIVEIIPEGINDYELAGGTQNKKLEQFAATPRVPDERRRHPAGLPACITRASPSCFRKPVNAGACRPVPGSAR